MRKSEFPLVDKIREEAYQQGREDAIEEFCKRLISASVCGVVTTPAIEFIANNIKREGQKDD